MSASAKALWKTCHLWCKSMTNFKRFYIWTLLALSLSMAQKTAAQTYNDSIPVSKMRVHPDKPLTKKISRQSNILGSYSAYLNKITYDGNARTYRHEWNHYKNYLMGAGLGGETFEQSYLLNALNEILSHFIDNVTIDTKSRESGKIFDSVYKENKRQQIKKIINQQTDYVLSSNSYLKAFSVNANIHQTLFHIDDILQLLDDLKNRLNSPGGKSDSLQIHKIPNIDKSTMRIIKDMYVFYIDDVELDLNAYLTEQDIQEINSNILNHKQSKKIIESHYKKQPWTKGMNKLRFKNKVDSLARMNALEHRLIPDTRE